MKHSTLIAVASRSFSKNAVLRSELTACYKNVRFNETGQTLKGSALVDFLKGADKAIIALEKVDEHLMEALPQLKTISKYGVGLDNIDLVALKKRNVSLGWTPGVNKRAVAELTLSLMITALRKINESSKLVKDGGWHQVLGKNLTGKTVGIVGCGHVGTDLLRILKPFECKIYIHDLLDLSHVCAEFGVTQVSFQEILQKSEVLSLHVPLTPETKHMISEKELSAMPKGAVLVNCARGGLVDEISLRDALISGQLGAAALDVFQTEPPVDHELIQLPNLIATSHIGGSSEEAILAMGRAAIQNLEASLK